VIMSSRLKKVLYGVPLACLAVAVLEFLAYRAYRDIGDSTFLVASVFLAGLSIWLSRVSTSRIGAVILGMVFSTLLLAGNAYYAGFVRNSLLKLAEDFGQSALVGIVTTIVVALIVLSVITAGIIQLIAPRRTESE
jgi:hypothetical protein